MTLHRLNKPWYAFRPDQIARRAFARDGAERVLPWGMPIWFDPLEMHGREIKRTGLIDIVVTETLFRLTAPNSVCLEVGANIGQMAAAMAFCASPGGSITAFEPSPQVLPLLERNVARWNQLPVASIELHPAACSYKSGVARMSLAASADNSGTGSLEGGDGQGVEVRVVRLDEVAPPRVDVVKIDVEGHEAAVLQGASRLLEERAIRDIVFEEHRTPPTAVTEALGRCGYRVFRIEHSFWHPKLVEPDAPVRLLYHPANYLATLDPERAKRLLEGRGWRCLRPRPPLRP